MKKSLSLVFSFVLFLCCCFCVINVPIVADAHTVENRYAGTAVPYGGLIQSYEEETVYYARKDETDKYINYYNLPVYMASGIENACAITAGGAIIGHFDRVYEELIPNHNGSIFMGQFVYGSQGAGVNAMHQELYRRMGSTSEGTTIPGYISGMTSYVKSKGRNIEISSIYSNSSLNRSAYMQALKADKLLTVFMDGFSIVGFGSLTTYDGYDTINSTVVKGLHTVAVYGYKNIRYYDASNRLIQEDNYLYVHTGFSTATLAMIRLNKYITIEDGYIINIT